MALKKIIAYEGQSFIHSQFGTIQTGNVKSSFEAVCKITAINGDKNKLNFTVLHSGENAQYERPYRFEPSVADGSVNFIKQAYLYLKTLPEFAGATDC
jgi:hypothetical protein